MTRLRHAVSGVLAAGVLWVAGCGSTSTQPPASPSKAVTPTGGGELEEDQKNADEAQPNTPPVMPTAAPGASGEPAIAGMPQAETELGRAEDELTTALSGTDCALICKAFASLQRAADHICALNGHDDPGGRCSRARRERDEARERVRRVCGSCA